MKYEARLIPENIRLGESHQSHDLETGKAHPVTLIIVFSQVLERLPQSIKTFPKGLHGCAEVFEPETTRLRPVDFEGPLKLALKERQFTETFCAAPLVFDYLCHKFVLGLPDILDSENVIDRVGQSRGRYFPAGVGNDEHYLYKHNLVAGTALGKFMQGIRQSLTSTRRGVWSLWGWQREFGGTSLPGL